MGAVSQLMAKHSVKIRRGRTDQGVERFDWLKDSLAINMQKTWKILTSVTENGLRDCLKLSKH